MDNALEIRTIAKITRRLIPFMFVCYICNYLDRLNVSAASLTMKVDLGFSDDMYGTGAGIFFLGYFLFEVPSNLILEKIGARIWIARIMITWGIISSAMMFVRSPASFYTLRFLLGLAEAGFFPGMVLYLTYWFPNNVRARAAAKFMVATTVSGIIGGPIAAGILNLNGTMGLTGWQWLFFLEGIPSVILGIIVLFYMTDKPENAHWLEPDEREWLIETMEREHAGLRLRRQLTWLQALRDRKVLHLAGLFFLLQICGYGLGFFSPLILQSRSDWSPARILILGTIPSLFGVVSMLVAAHYSDRSGERRKYLYIALLFEAAAIAIAAYVRSPWLTIACFSVQSLAGSARNAPFWAISTTFLTGSASAGGIAFINSVGNLGGFAGSKAFGWIKSQTASYDAGLYLFAAILAIAAVIAMKLTPDVLVGESNAGTGDGDAITAAV